MFAVDDLIPRILFGVPVFVNVRHGCDGMCISDAHYLVNLDQL